MSKETELVIKNFTRNINPGSADFTGEFYQTVKEKAIPICLTTWNTSKKKVNRREYSKISLWGQRKTDQAR